MNVIYMKLKCDKIGMQFKESQVKFIINELMFGDERHK
jgi:hypothetical protein